MRPEIASQSSGPSSGRAADQNATVASSSGGARNVAIAPIEPDSPYSRPSTASASPGPGTHPPGNGYGARGSSHSSGSHGSQPGAFGQGATGSVGKSSSAMCP